MEQLPKIEMLKDTIYQLYSKEGRPLGYISRLLNIDKKTLKRNIEVWGFPTPASYQRITPSTQKFINKHRQYIKSQLDKNISITSIAQALGIPRRMLSDEILPYDAVLKRARDEYLQRLNSNTHAAKSEKAEDTSLCYIFEDIRGEKWRSILGYDGYMVSNMGRIKHRASNQEAYHLVEPLSDGKAGRKYVMLYDGERYKTLSRSRIVAHAFVYGHDEGHDIVDYKNGDIEDDRAKNLEWVSRSDNDLYAEKGYRLPETRGKRRRFSAIRYRGKYEFKTVSAFARFIGKSEGEVFQYLKTPGLYDIELVK